MVMLSFFQVLFRKRARKDGWTEEQIEKVTKEAMSGDYHHLVATLSKYCKNGGFQMRSGELWKICLEIYRKMYQEADPAADFDKLVQSGLLRKKTGFWITIYPWNDKQKLLTSFVRSSSVTREKEKRLKLKCYWFSSKQCKEAMKKMRRNWIKLQGIVYSEVEPQDRGITLENPIFKNF